MSTLKYLPSQIDPAKAKIYPETKTYFKGKQIVQAENSPGPDWKETPPTAIDFLVAGDMSLDDYKKIVCEEIDRKTEASIAEGFVFQNNTFSLSQNAQLNWTSLRMAYIANTLSFPQVISTKDDGAFELTKDNASEFFDDLFSFLKTVLDTGRKKKIAIQAAKDLTAIKKVKL
jgi:predicted AAA+ superfamily ATPase